jgi:hypothetical protein
MDRLRDYVHFAPRNQTNPFDPIEIIAIRPATIAMLPGSTRT